MVSIEKYRQTSGPWSPAERLGAFLDTQTLKKNPLGHQKILCGISKNLNLKLIIEFFHLLIIPMTLFNDIMPYFDEFIHVYGLNMSIDIVIPHKNLDAQNFSNCQF